MQYVKDSSLDFTYWVYFPEEEYEEDPGRLPVIFYLHGMGEIGDAKALGESGILKDLKEELIAPNAIIVAPLLEESSWSDCTEKLRNFMGKIIEKYDIDVTKVCLTSMSLGTDGAWRLFYENSEFFSSFAPLAGRSASSGLGKTFVAENAAELTDTPVCIVRDTVYNDEENIQEMIVENIESAEGEVHVIQTDYSHAQISTHAYLQQYEELDGMTIIEWMLSKSTTDK